MKEKECEKAGKYTFNIRWMMYIPIMVLLGIVPLIVRLVKTAIPDERILYLTNNNIDLFSQGKSTLIIAIVGVILLATFLAFNKEYIKWDKISKIYYVNIAIFIVMTIVSTFLSEYSHVAKWGLPTRAEGGIMIVCYMIILLYTFNIVTKTTDYKYLLVPLAFLSVVLTIIGYYQYIGEDLLMTEWGKQIIIPDHYSEDRALLQPLYGKGNVYGTLFHYNYVGSFAAMMVPLFVTLTCFLKDYKWKVLCGVISICSLFLLFGSTARSGLIGLACSVVVGIILFSGYFIKQWKATLTVIIAGVVMVVGLDVATKGAIFSRIPTLVQDMVGMFQPGDTTGDYKETLPIKGIAHEGDRATIDLGNEKLQVFSQDDTLKFQDGSGQEIVYIYMNLGKGNEQYFTQDTRFEDYRFLITKENDKQYAKLVYKDTYVATFSVQEQVHLVDHFTKEPMELVEPESIGFKGKEKLGSSRGYIWSRSLPILKSTFLIGTGPDTYGFEFPQNDLLGKWYAYDDPNMIVDKPHNLYLQIAIQQGVVALIAFLVIVVTYLVQCLKLYGFKKNYDEQHIVGMALMLAVVGYLGAGLFNDSVVSVAPIFWILLGAGMAINYLIKNQTVGEEI